jgi:uncharacterized damage-inducible protein DinB
MNIIELLLKEMEQEAQVTRKMLERVPIDKLDWKPHEKSMSMKSLAVHIAELPSWVTTALTTDGLDFSASPYSPTHVTGSEELLQLFEKSLKEGQAALSNATEEDLKPTWTLRDGEKVFNVFTKYEVIRHAFAQTTHHRAQLGVYLRLLHIPISGSYGPSADEQW